VNFTSRKTRRNASGAILFEVVLALALFVFAAAVISGGFSASLKSVDRMRAELDASNLAISTLAEIELGLRPMTTSPSAEFEPPLEQWTWEVEVTEPSEDLDMGGGLTLVEVIIRNEVQERETRIARMIRTATTSPAAMPE
jgi:type II secretory pathway pseudopilin PulG